MTRDEVLQEFNRPYQSHEDVGGPDTEAMADEIVRLREQSASLEIERAAAMHELTLLQLERNAIRDANEQIKQRLAAVEAERDAEKQRRREIDDEAFVYAEQVEVMRRRVGAMQAVLAALREPSRAVLDAANEADGGFLSYGDVTSKVIRAAVAAAEREVGA